MSTAHKQTRLLADTEGAILTEGVIVLPVFVLVLASVLYFHNLYAAKLDANVAARACAWDYAVKGCDPTSKKPKHCKVGKVTNGFQALGGSTLNNSPFKDSSGGSGGQQETKSDLELGLAGANRIGLGLMGLREGVVVSASRDLTKPSILGGGKKSVSSNYTVMCNEIERSPGELAIEGFCALGSEMNFPGCKQTP